MRYAIHILVLASLNIVVSGCKKSADEDVTHTTSITGSWELRRGQGSFTMDYAAGNGNVLQFSDSTYVRYESGSEVKSGRYNIVSDTSVVAEVGLVIPSGQFSNRIIFDGDTASRKIFIEVSNNTLTLLSGYFPLDGGSRLIYERQRSNNR